MLFVTVISPKQIDMESVITAGKYQKLQINLFLNFMSKSKESIHGSGSRKRKGRGNDQKPKSLFNRTGEARKLDNKNNGASCRLLSINGKAIRQNLRAEKETKER